MGILDPIRAHLVDLTARAEFVNSVGEVIAEVPDDEVSDCTSAASTGPRTPASATCENSSRAVLTRSWMYSSNAPPTAAKSDLVRSVHGSRGYRWICCGRKS